MNSARSRSLGKTTGRGRLTRLSSSTTAYGFVLPPLTRSSRNHGQRPRRHGLNARLSVRLAGPRLHSGRAATPRRTGRLPTRSANPDRDTYGSSNEVLRAHVIPSPTTWLLSYTSPHFNSLDNSDTDDHSYRSRAKPLTYESADLPTRQKGSPPIRTFPQTRRRPAPHPFRVARVPRERLTARGRRALNGITCSPPELR